jgi:aldose 1-epimerase
MKKALALISSAIACLILFPSCKEQPTTGISASVFGKLPDGREAKIYTLVNTKGNIAKVTDYGAKLVSLEVPDREGKLENVILGYDSLAGYINGDPYFGATVGRYANRIAKGKFTIDGKEYSLALNNGVNHLHGGPGGYHSVLWNSEVIKHNGIPVLKLTYKSPDGEEGYPGNLDIELIYSWNDQDELVIDYSAVSDQNTHVNLTHHSLFNLKGAGEGDILGHELTIAADAYTPVDSTLIPIGEIRDVKGTPFDFNSPVAVGKRIDDQDEQMVIGKGYDHNWVLKSTNINDVAARLYEPESGRVMEVYTTEPGIQFYSGNFLDGSQIGHGNKPYDFRFGLALETQHFPDSPNQPNFPSTLLEKGVKYSQTTIYKFLIK